MFLYRYTATTTHTVPSLSAVTSPAESFVSASSDYNDATGLADICIVNATDPNMAAIPYLSNVALVSKTPWQ